MPADKPELLFSPSGQIQVFSANGYEGDIEIFELLDYAFRCQSADDTGVSIVLPVGGGETKGVGYVEWLTGSTVDDIGELPEAMIIRLENGLTLSFTLLQLSRAIAEHAVTETKGYAGRIEMTEVS